MPVLLLEVGGSSVTYELKFSTVLCIIVGRGPTPEVSLEDQITHLLKLIKIQSWSFWSFPHFHKWEEVIESLGPWKRGREKKIKSCLPRPTMHEQDFPCVHAARPAQGELARAHICQGHVQLAKYRPWATSHKPHATSHKLGPICFHFIQPGLLEDSFVPRGLTSEQLVTWKLLQLENWLGYKYVNYIQTELKQLISQNRAFGEIPVENTVRDKFEDRFF